MITLDESDIAEVKAMHKRGVSPSIIAELMGVSYKRVCAILEIERSVVAHKDHCIKELCSEWNAGVKSGTLARKYGFRTGQDVACFASHHRSHGFIKRREVAPTRAQSLVDEWNNGASVESLVDKYQFKNRRSLGNSLARLRKIGYNINKRVGGTEKKRNNILRRRDGRL